MSEFNANHQRIIQFLSSEMSEEEKNQFLEEVNQNSELQKELDQFKDVIRAVRRDGVIADIQKVKQVHLIKKWLGIAVGTLLVGAAIFLAIQFSYNHLAVDEHVELLKDKYDHAEYFEIMPQRDTVIETANGTVLAIPEYAFVDHKGKVVNQPVKLVISEFADPTSIIDQGLSTTSNGKALETGGMFHFNAFSQGKGVAINSGKSILVSVPADEKLENMQLFEGKEGVNGEINWVNPKPLIKELHTVDIHSLNFYPPGFEFELAELSDEIWTKKSKDSLFYSFFCRSWGDQPFLEEDPLIEEVIKSPEQSLVDGKAFFEGNCVSCHQLGSDAAYPNLVGISKRRSRNWIIQWVKNPSKFAKMDNDAAALMAEWKPKSGVMNAFDWMSDQQMNDLLHYLGYAHQNYDLSGVDSIASGSQTCGIQPSSIKAIWNEKYQNTFIATKEFEKRLPYIYQSCSPALLRLYVSNLDKPLAYIDSIVAASLTGDLQHQFQYFADLNEGGVKVTDQLQSALNKYFQKRSKAFQLAAEKSYKAYWNRQNELDREASREAYEHQSDNMNRASKLYQQEYDLNLEEACKQLGIKKPQVRQPAKASYQFNLSNLGWKNIDRFVADVTNNRETATFKGDSGKTATLSYSPITVRIKNESNFDFVKVYLTSNQLSTFIRLEIDSAKYKYSLNDLIDYNLILVGYKNETPYINSIESLKADSTLTINKSTEKDLKALVQKLSKRKPKRDVFEDLEFFKTQEIHKKRKAKNQNMMKLRSELYDIVFPCNRPEYQFEDLNYEEALEEAPEFDLLDNEW